MRSAPGKQTAFAWPDRDRAPLEAAAAPTPQECPRYIATDDDLPEIFFAAKIESTYTHRSEVS
jgi:hypothetical protein